MSHVVVLRVNTGLKSLSWKGQPRNVAFCTVINISWDLKIYRPWILKLLHCGMWRLVFWYFVTKVLKKNFEDAGSRFFQNSVTLVKKFQRKLLKVQTAFLQKFWCIPTNVSKKILKTQAGDSSKILVHSYQCFKKNLNMQGADSSKILEYCYKCFKGKYWRCRQQTLPKFWYACTALCDLISLDIVIIFTTG